PGRLAPRFPAGNGYTYAPVMIDAQEIPSRTAMTNEVDRRCDETVAGRCDRSDACWCEDAIACGWGKGLAGWWARILNKWQTELHDRQDTRLLSPQRRERADRAGAACGQPDRDQRDDGQHDRHHD